MDDGNILDENKLKHQLNLGVSYLNNTSQIVLKLVKGQCFL